MPIVDLLPIKVKEIETGDVSIIESKQALLEFVDEFQDILNAEFIFYDKDGFRLTIAENFFDNPDHGVTHDKESLKKVKKGGHS